MAPPTTTYAYETPRLWLEKLTIEKHLDDMHELWNNPKALLWSSHPVRETPAETKAWIVGQMSSAENPDIDKYAVLLRPVAENPQPWVNKEGKPKMVAMLGTNRYSDHGLEAGYCVNYEFWGRGIAGEAFRGFLEMYWSLPERAAVKQLNAKVDSGNIPSQKIIIRAGGRKVEVLKEFYSRTVDKGVKRDIDSWVIDRPGVTEGELVVWKEEVERQMVRKREVERLEEEKEKEREGGEVGEGIEEGEVTKKGEVTQNDIEAVHAYI